MCLGKVSGIVTSLPIIGGITACGIFLLIVSIIGLIGAMRHHQVVYIFKCLGDVVCLHFNCLDDVVCLHFYLSR